MRRCGRNRDACCAIRMCSRSCQGGTAVRCLRAARPGDTLDGRLETDVRVLPVRTRLRMPAVVVAHGSYSSPTSWTWPRGCLRELVEFPCTLPPDTPAWRAHPDQTMNAASRIPAHCSRGRAGGALEPEAGVVLRMSDDDHEWAARLTEHCPGLAHELRANALPLATGSTSSGPIPSEDSSPPLSNHCGVKRMSPQRRLLTPMTASHCRLRSLSTSSPPAGRTPARDMSNQGDHLMTSADCITVHTTCDSTARGTGSVADRCSLRKAEVSMVRSGGVRWYCGRVPARSICVHWVCAGARWPRRCGAAAARLREHAQVMRAVLYPLQCDFSAQSATLRIQPSRQAVDIAGSVHERVWWMERSKTAASRWRRRPTS